MADPTYQPKVYRKQGGDELVVSSGGKITIELGGEVIDLQSQGSSMAALLFHHDIVVPHSSGGSTVELVIAHRFQIIDVTAVKTGGSATASTSVVTVQIKTAADGAITDAMDIKVADKAIVRAAQLDDSLHIIAAGGTIKATKIGVGNSTTVDGDQSCIVRITGVKRSP